VSGFGKPEVSMDGPLPGIHHAPRTRFIHEAIPRSASDNLR
jgi:hypothetical protein